MIKIAITGPESTGKTTLCQALADHFDVKFIPEFSREYLEKTNGEYQQLDLDFIAQQQLKHLLSSSNELVICDTDFIVLEIWSHYKYGEVSDLIYGLIDENHFDLHILCTPDIPWEEDPLRENPTTREELFKLYAAALKKHNKHFIIVSGSRENRIKQCLQSIDLLLKK